MGFSHRKADISGNWISAFNYALHLKYFITLRKEILNYMLDIKLNDREQYTFFRRKHKIKLLDVAKYIGCSIPLLSLWERNLANMDIKKIKMYKLFVENYRIN